MSQDKAEELVGAKQLLTNLRKLSPMRPMTYSEHLVVSERQAERLHSLLEQDGPAASLTWLVELPGLTIVLRPRWRMEGASGASFWKDGRWIVGINKGDSHARRRFTLAHELKHIIDAQRDRITYKQIDDRHRELIANYFAACYLMPRSWIRRCWSRGLRDPEALAGLFNVSTEAMTRRLTYLGFIDDQPERELTTYFRLTEAA